MIKLDTLRKLIECSILTGYVDKDQKDQFTNLLLIAQAESGKSELIQAMQKYPNVYYTNDLSFRGLVDEIIPKFERDEASHLLIPDFINVLSHKKASETLIPVLNTILAEGLKDLKFYGSSRVFSKEINGGLITGMTKSIFEKKIILWRNNGFLSRILPISFSYSEITKLEIHNYIKNGNYEKTTSQKDFSRYKLKSFKIKIPEDISNMISLLAEQLSERNSNYVFFQTEFQKRTVNLETYGFRLHKQLRSLLKGITLYNAELEPNKFEYTTTEMDFLDLKSFAKYMNFSFTQI